MIAVKDLVLAGICLLDFGILLAAENCKRIKVAKRAVWMDGQTHRALRDACGAIVLALWANSGPIHFPSLSERVLETRFGRIRSVFPSFQMTVPD